MSAAFLAAMLTACAPFAAEPPVEPVRRLPAAPDWLRPVAGPEPRAGDDARALGDQLQAALSLANARLVQARAWYGRLGKTR